jgi:hypothetical protein
MTDSTLWRGLARSRNLLQVALLLLAPATIFATDIPPKVEVGDFVAITLNPDERCFVLRDGLKPVRTIETKDGIAFTGRAGRYAVMLFSTTQPGQETLFTEFVDSIQPAPPQPKPDDPVPPAPPTPNPAPVPGDLGFKVLLIYESSALPPAVPRAQYDIQLHPEVRDWLTKNTTAEGQWAGWRIGDPDRGVAGSTPFFGAAMALPRTSLPWLVINDGQNKRGYSGPMPKDSDEMLKLLKGFR